MKYLKQLVLCILLSILAVSVKSQKKEDSNSVNDYIRCYTTEAEAERRAKNPEVGSIDDFEFWLQEKMVRTPQNVSREILTIPAVVHIIHNGEEVGTGANISYEQILSQIEVINEDFRRKEGTKGYNEDSVGADIEIEFCLANFDNEGRWMRIEPGVNRIDRNEMGWNAGPYSQGYMNGVIKPESVWDPNLFLNIWVTELNGILGYAQFPAQSTLPGLGGSTSALTDGVVVRYQAFGRIGNVSGPYNLGRTLTHEIGHWLGLRHIWGDGDCSRDDYCDDTPSADGPNNGGCGSDRISCGSVNMVENYMDYTIDACTNIFTQCQKNRMLTVMENSPRRKELINSYVCATPTVSPTAAFTVGSAETCDGQIDFFDASTDLPTQWFWLFGNGQTSEEKNPRIQYEQSGTYTVTLVASNELGVSTTSKDIEVSLLGGTIDAGGDINTCQGDEVQLNATSSAENGTILWFPTVGVSDATILNPILSANGNVRQYILSITLENGCELRDTIAVNVSTKPTTLILPTSDVSIDKGQSFQLNAIGAETYKWSPDDGLSDPNIPNPVASPEATTAYTVTGFNKDSCFQTDQIVITVIPPANIEDGIWEGIGEIIPVFPNPASTQFSLEAEFSLGGELEINLLDISGKMVSGIYDSRVGIGSFTHTWNRKSEVSAGFYLIEWKLEGRRFMQKIQLY